METTNPAAPTSGAKTDPTEATHLTRQQRAALFAEAAKGTEPARKSEAELELLEWRPVIAEYYRRGYNLTQIRAFLASPKINVQVSLRALERLIKPASPAKPATTGKP